MGPGFAEGCNDPSEQGVGARMSSGFIESQI